MGAVVSAANSNSWERINRSHANQASSSKATAQLLKNITGASLVTSSWRCGCVAISQCIEKGGYRMIAGSKEPFGRAAFQVKVWDITGVEPVHLKAEVQPPPPSIDIRFGLLGHTAPVVTVAISENSHIGATAGDDNMILVWDLKRGKERVRIKDAHSKGVKCIRVSPTGNWAITCSWDKTVKLWDLFKGICIGVGEAGRQGAADEDEGGHMDGAMGCDLQVLSHPGERAGGWGASGAWDGTVKLWHLRGMKLAKTLRGHTGKVWDVRLACQMSESDVIKALSCGSDATLRIWTVPEGEPVAVLRGHSNEVISCAMRVDGLVGASASFDMSTKIWDFRREQCRRTVSLALDRPACCAMSQDGLVMVAASEDDTVTLLVTMEQIKVDVKLGIVAGGMKEIILHLVVDTDDGFDVLCEQLEKALSDRNLVDASHPYAELPARFQKFNYAHAARAGLHVAPTEDCDKLEGGDPKVMAGVECVGGKTWSETPMTSSFSGLKGGGKSKVRAGVKEDVGKSGASAANTQRSLMGGNSRRSELEGKSERSAEHTAVSGRSLGAKHLAPSLSWEGDRLTSVRDLGISDGAALQLLKPSDPFEDMTLEEIQALGDRLRGNLWWEKQEKQAAVLIKEFAKLREERANERRNEKKIKEVSFANKHTHGAQPGRAAAHHDGSAAAFAAAAAKGKWLNPAGAKKGLKLAQKAGSYAVKMYPSDA